MKIHKGLRALAGLALTLPSCTPIQRVQQLSQRPVEIASTNTIYVSEGERQIEMRRYDVDEVLFVKEHRNPDGSFDRREEKFHRGINIPDGMTAEVLDCDGNATVLDRHLILDQYFVPVSDSSERRTKTFSETQDTGELYVLANIERRAGETVLNEEGPLEKVNVQYSTRNFEEETIFEGQRGITRQVRMRTSTYPLATLSLNGTKLFYTEVDNNQIAGNALDNTLVEISADALNDIVRQTGDERTSRILYGHAFVPTRARLVQEPKTQPLKEPDIPRGIYVDTVTSP